MADTHIRTREGQTAEMQFQLLRPDGTPVNLSTAHKLELVLAAGQGSGRALLYATTDSPSPKLRIIEAASGKVAFEPSQLRTSESPYHGYFRLWTTPSAWEPVPADGDLVIEVLPGYTT